MQTAPRLLHHFIPTSKFLVTKIQVRFLYFLSRCLLNYDFLLLVELLQSCSEETIRQYLIDSVSHLNVQFSDVPLKTAAAHFKIELKTPTRFDDSMASLDTITLASLPPPENTPSGWLDEFSPFGNSDDGLGLEIPLDIEALLDVGEIPQSVSTIEDGGDVSSDTLPVLLDNMAAEEIESLLSNPSSPGDSVNDHSAPKLYELATSTPYSQPALADYDDEEWQETPRKAKRPRVARSTRVRRAKPYDDFVLEEESRPVLGRPSDPTLRLPERKIRKKEQNKDAAMRYRQKKSKEMGLLVKEQHELEERNKELKKKEEELQQRVEWLKGFLKEIYEKKGKQLPAVLKSK